MHTLPLLTDKCFHEIDISFILLYVMCFTASCGDLFIAYMLYESSLLYVAPIFEKFFSPAVHTEKILRNSTDCRATMRK